MSRKRKIGNPALNNFVVDTLQKSLKRIREFFVPGILCRNKSSCTVWRDAGTWAELNHQWTLFGTPNYMLGEAYKVINPETVFMVVKAPTLVFNKKHTSLSIFTCEVLIDDRVWFMVLSSNINTCALGNMFDKLETKRISSINNEEEKHTCL